MEKRRDVFQAIADPTRREIISLISRKSLNLNAIAENFDSSRPTISQHIKLLEECGLITVQKKGRERFCSVQTKPLKEVSAWIDHLRKYWESKLDDLENYVDKL